MPSPLSSCPAEDTLSPRLRPSPAEYYAERSPILASFERAGVRRPLMVSSARRSGLWYELEVCVDGVRVHLVYPLVHAGDFRRCLEQLGRQLAELLARRDDERRAQLALALADEVAA